MAGGTGSSGTPAPPGPDPATGLYSGQSAPLATLTATDQGGVVAIGTSLALVFALISMLIRFYVRTKFQRDVGSRDDAASAAAMILFIIQSGLVFGQVHQGLGRSIEDVTPDGLVTLQKSEYASDIFYLLSIFLTKLSIVYLFIRLSPDRNHKRAAWLCLAATTLFTFTTILITCLRCDMLKPWIFIGTQCPGLLARWQVTAVFDIVTELGIFGVAAYMTHGLKTTVSKKFVVLIAFGLRVLVIIPILLRLLYLSNEISSPDPTLDGAMTSICTQIHIAYAIIATTTPCLRPFMSALSTHYGGPKEAKTPNGSKLSKLTGGSGSGNNSKTPKRQPDHNTLKAGYDLDEITAVGPDVEKPRPAAREWDHERLAYRSAVVVSTCGGGDAGSTQSNDSQRMIISKNTEWQVEYQGEGGEHI
ncbi:hypothetical protein B0T16DRAFT_461695 [Cercophora newfieldiana]|uniref:Rhodopsin domain-containing protein n=1 Tax=Cercophora newfieldiana TaxID=92897 RepID=A0AA39XWP6_9PEZI|nr:hypothetical protein B0T16DRAFT_461695 [Cercophora newfieldiana]